MPGRTLGGRYEVQDKVGAGGMAVVYRGLDRVLGRTVAIKTMLPQYANDSSFAARFKQEAQAAAALQSPYIVSVYDWGKDNDTYYIVMEYLRGTDLKSGIRRHGALDGKKVAQIGSQIAQALSVAHRHDIIHRDIKPQNIMVQPDGNIKVMDFGIARAKNSHLTTDNSVLGTAHYVSPEQTQGKPLGPTTDIYSLGVVMYEAATGSVPFDGDDAISVALKQVNETPQPPSQRNPAIDPSLEGIILKCMQKNPDARFQSADELVRVLHDYLAGRLQEVNNATAVLPLAAATAQIGAPSATATQRVTPVRTTSARARQTSATELAREQQEAEERRKSHRTIFGVLGAIALVIAVIAILWTTIFAGGGTKAVPNLSNLSRKDAIETIESTNWFKVGEVREGYSDTVESGRVMSQDPAANKQFAKDTEINITISKGEKPAEDVSVPDLSNMTAKEAEDALLSRGLIAKAGEGVYTPDVEAGKVVSQDPKPGTAAKAGDSVTYQLSLGVESVKVPDVTGMDQDNATATLNNAGFKVDVREEASDEVTKGVVFRQSATGKADKGSTIVITISSGPSSIDVPSVVGFTQEEAQSALSDVGFEVSVETASSSNVEKGTVISQSPGGGRSASVGSTITITVSTGPAQSDNSSQ
ncbi:Stk1 family PASTA domain-containing Ser/Thr kinase [Atopobium sp. oral taxon 810]|uniref:Stk1 family PASTA domain-containing Ser/Thr kinase n=1 Tax=Atopobium sp. oral taxon 810 TaxID=712158 RepID=UPI000397C48F|nr:Stk1 family PASTA domain-containing Ser/Thr kinase [Atopobium sp. oral taxon 810]ERI06339.1 kinase domain protein [Atopobium sp. oral taxon 810 str. F0209]